MLAINDVFSYKFILFGANKYVFAKSIPELLSDDRLALYQSLLRLFTFVC